jgi:hypothetical protein
VSRLATLRETVVPSILRGKAVGSSEGRLGELPRVRRWALAASLVWTVVVLGYAVGFLAVSSQAQTRGMVMLDGLFALLTLVLPLLLVWLAAWLAEELARQRAAVAALIELAAPLVGELAATRRTLASHAPVDADALGAVASGQRRLQSTLDALLPGAPSEPTPQPQHAPEPLPAPAPRPKRVATPAPAPPPDQPSLPLLSDTNDPARPDWAHLVRALDFPRDAQDFEGFRALQAVLRYRPLAQMLQAAEDVLTLLSQEGVYMDDVAVEPVDPAAWRRFMAGTRGASVAAVGAIRDAQTLELARGLLKSDPIFRDTALFFQRRFDRVLVDFAREAGDDQIAELANTRSGRAFMLLARLSGSFA